ncbi:hypothetical protein PU629_05700 [Pullulanibacillus sp. KACC 23026]|uniref:hypothetical protein n=1 Tax=Pullulanibacillus sp. KACC 23026 TaxID=3028315 RepID=UPI0023B1E956|nr:hypothetical protein [Pullulanibacillus sp. KACC 23026]WEG13860.1 hypothetical protein PU629_05700 [Pullulanibacillus sp. KACC 23026]
MVKKITALLSAVAIAFFFVFGVSHAETVTSGKMFKTFNSQYKQANYDYKSGSLKLEDAKTFKLDKPIKVKNGNDEVQVTTVQAAVAHFKTMRDGIFFKDWKDYAYYAPDAGVVLTEGDVMNIPAIKAYEKAHSTSVRLELGPISGFLALIIIVPIIAAFVLSRRGYSSLEFKLNNNLIEPAKK